MASNKNTVIQSTTMQELRKKAGYQLQQEVLELHRSSQTSMIEIGKRLIILKETVLRAKEFRKFIEEEVRIGYDIANKYMRIVKRYAIDKEQEKNAEVVIELGIKKADKLLRISDLEQRMQYIEENDLKNKSFTEISEMLDKDFKTEERVIALKPIKLTSSIEANIHNNINLINKNINNKGVSKDVKMELKVIKDEMEGILSKITKLNEKLQEIKEKEEKELENIKDNDNEQKQA